jgi:hypothetical protein
MRQNFVCVVRNREDALASTRDACAGYTFALQTESKYLFLMPTEISIPDAEDLKSRVRELRRFL